MSENNQNNGIEELLMENPHVVEIHHYSHPTFPNIDTSQWISSKKAEREIGYIQDYIDSVCIEDDFGTDHASRRAWRDGIGKDRKIRKLLQDDPLRANNYDGIDHHVEELRRGYTGSNKDRFDELKDKMFEDFPDEYGSLSFQDKLAVVNRTKERTYGILQFLATQSPAFSN